LTVALDELGQKARVVGMPEDDDELLNAGLVVLDDDPTGTQAIAGAPVVVDISGPGLAEAFSCAPTSIYISTNTRALSGVAAGSRLTQVVSSVRAKWPEARFIMRGDSTLRGHVGEEFMAVRGPRVTTLVLVPAMPGAGRLTLGGHHYLVRDGVRQPVHLTEYACDADFSYATSSVLGWLAERTAGYFDPADGVVVDLEALRATGGAAVRDAIAMATDKGRPAGVVLDAGSEDDLAVAASGIRQAFLEELPFALRSAPPLAASLARRSAAGLVPLPSGCRRALVVAGSYVATTTRQLAALESSYPGATVVVDIEALLERPEAEQRRLLDAMSAAWARSPVAALTTPRGVPADKSLVERGLLVAGALARAVSSVSPAPDVVVAKGGVTSAVVASRLGPPVAWAVGPVVPGVALWDLGAGAKTRWLVVFAGNIGQDGTLAELLAKLVEA
jgi:uncharacterized protein YgbK (DUF1537 family)